jgi:hypothetical protein
MSSLKPDHPKSRLWPAFVWAAFPPILLIGLGALLTLNGDPPPFFLVLLLVTASICEGLGLGHFYILGGSTIPDWLLFAVMGALAYTCSLVLVLCLRSVIRWAIGLRRSSS